MTGPGFMAPLAIAFFANMAWASLAMLVVLLIRRPVARLFGAGPAYALWLLPVLRLVTPPLPAFAPDISPTLPPLTVIVSVTGEAAPLPPDGGPGQWVPLLLAIWAGGAAVLLLWQVLAYRHFIGRLRLTERSLGAHDGLPLVASAGVDGPLALGLLRRSIVVPVDFEARYSAGERRLALDHEAVHHRRGDLWWNHLGLVILALNWFNPIAWIAFRAFRADQELACDARVTAAASPGARQDYARALVKSASRPGLIAACPLNHADQLKRRLKMMKHHRIGRARAYGGAAAVALLAGASLAFGVPSFARQSETATQTQTQTERSEQRSQSTDRDERREERVIIITRPGDHDGHHADGERRRETVRTIIRTDHDGDLEGGDGDHDDHVRHFTLMHEGDGDHGDHVRHFTLMRDGHGEHVVGADCRDGNRPMVNSNENHDGQQVRFILCGPNNMDPARQIHALERAREALAGEGELSAEGRQRALATIDAELARLRGANR